MDSKGRLSAPDQTRRETCDQDSVPEQPESYHTATPSKDVHCFVEPQERHHSGDGGAEHDSFLSAYSACESEDRIEEKAGQSTVLESCSYEEEQHCPANHRPCPIMAAPTPVISITPTMSPVLGLEVSTPSAHPASVIGCVCGPSGLAWDRSPECLDHDLVSAAAHLHLLGESLSLIGHHLQETNKSVCMSSSLFLLLDSLLCALPPLIGLTSQVPELRSCTEHTLASTLENIAYVMPGL